MTGVDSTPNVRLEVSGSTADVVVQAHTLHGGVHLSGDPRWSSPVPRQLPARPRWFTGRAGELAALTAAVEKTTEPAHTVVISTIAGAGGIGKTSLALHWAHDNVDRFPDGQLYVNLHGFDPMSRPTAPGAVLDDLLRTLNVPPAQIPHDVDAKAGLYRSLLHGRRVLVLLDNAANERQVEPLLPAGKTCLALITTRRNLAINDQAILVTLDVLTSNESIELLSRMVSAERITAEPGMATTVTELCGYYPIALTLIAQRLRAHPNWTFGHLDNILRATSRPLTELIAGRQSVEAIFDLSYRALAAEQQAAFCLLSRHPGTEFSAPSVAALLDIAQDAAHKLLESLFDDFMITQPTIGRYSFHDLLRSYALARADRDLPRGAYNTAIRRLLEWYLDTTDRAVRVLRPQPRPSLSRPSHEPGRNLTFTSYADALAWCEAERQAIVAATRIAGDLQLNDLAWKLPTAMRGFLYLRKYWSDWISTHVIALEAARELDDRYATARTLNGLGAAYADLRRYREAILHYEQALTAYRNLPDAYGESSSLDGLGIVYRQLGRFDDAIEYHTRALVIRREIKNRYTEGISLNNLGSVCLHAGCYQEAISYYNEALSVRKETDDLYGTGATQGNLGEVYLRLNLHRQAAGHLEESVAISRRLGDRRGTARNLRLLGDALHSLGELERANTYRSEAAEIFGQIGDTRGGPDSREDL